MYNGAAMSPRHKKGWLNMAYTVEIWDKKYPYAKSLKEVCFESFDMALDFAASINEKKDNPVTIWENNVRVMDIG